MNEELNELRELIQSLQSRIDYLEEEVRDQAETIRGLTVDTEQNTQSINTLQSEQNDYRWELDEIGAEVDTFMAGRR